MSDKVTYGDIYSSSLEPYPYYDQVYYKHNFYADYNYDGDKILYNGVFEYYALFHGHAKNNYNDNGRLTDLNARSRVNIISNSNLAFCIDDFDIRDFFYNHHTEIAVFFTFYTYAYPADDFVIRDDETGEIKIFSDNTAHLSLAYINFSCDVKRFVDFDAELVDLSCDVDILFTADVSACLVDSADIFPAGSASSTVAVSIDAADISVTPDDSNNATGLQSFEIILNEQQITETVNFTTIEPFDIMQLTAGQFLDYRYILRVESVTQRGILYSCRCGSNLDDLLYSQLAYQIPELSRKERNWHTYELGEFSTGEVTTDHLGNTFHDSDSFLKAKMYDTPPQADASEHAKCIAAALGIGYKFQFDDFVSTADCDTSGTTYADLIRNIFGWTARIPTLLINVFIRDDILHVIQRGHEEHVIDISNAKITSPIFTRDFIRTHWGETPYVNTEVRSFNTYKTIPVYEFDYDFNDNGDVDNGNILLPEGYISKDQRIYDPYAPLLKSQSRVMGDKKVQSYYNYDNDGLLVKTIEKYSGENEDGDEEELGHTITVHEYKSFDGNKFLWRETTTVYDKSGNVTDTRINEYSPTGHSQAAVSSYDDSSDTAFSTIKNMPYDERPSPYTQAQTLKALVRQRTGTKQEQRLIAGIVPFDTSFPVYGEDKLVEITEAIKWLNHKTRETVSLSLYEFPHLIDFNDRIVLNGNVYFLSSNTLTTTPRVYNEQNLSLVRWF